ncbi:MAG: hypothetical protein PHC97_02690 [Patescibacteria group bacterium]|nr:hypothetical protein [Patescibacteria group bacterium]
MKEEMIGDVPGNVLGMLADLNLKLQHGGITPQELGLFLKRKNPFGKSDSVADQIAGWQEFYRKVYGLKADFSSLRIPERQKGFDRLIIVVPGMTPQRLYDKCKEMFPCWKWTDSDLGKIVTSDRTAQNGAYAVWFRDRVEADEELKKLSANELKERGIVGATLEERLLHEQVYFLETGKHLDVENATLCSGSRYGDGGVPSVRWGDSGLGVFWCGPGFCRDLLRARAAVS